MKQEVSIRDVAKIAGVSPATVSRVLNNTANVEETKREKVLKAVSETGFVPNQIARSLFKKSSKIIGYIIPSMQNPFFSELGKHIESTLFEKNYKLIICNSDDNGNKEKEYIEMLHSMNADGIIIATSQKNAKYISKIPIIAIDRKIKNGKLFIHSDNYEGGRIQTEHLLSRGCKEIVCLKNSLGVSSASLRFKGYCDVCEENGLKTKYIDCDYTFEDGLLKTPMILEKYPKVDGIVALNDMVALGVYKGLSQLNIKVPEDIKLIGFDNINLSSITTPEITTISQPIEQMGKMATNMLLDIVEDKKSFNKDEFNTQKILDVELIVRQTT